MEPILIEQYNYPLPDDRIAKYPLSKRDQSKLLIYKDGEITERHFYQIADQLPVNSLLIYNNTRVIQARLVFHKQNSTSSSTDACASPVGARIEIFCLEPLVPQDYQLNLSSQTGCVWKCMIGNLKKWKQGPLFLTIGNTTLSAERLASTGNTHEVKFTWNNTSISFAEILDAMGELPIPPYLNRKTEETDKTTYQTIYSHIKGSVAAPTAGLHFTQDVLNDLKQKGIHTGEVTLHVGAGTFWPVKTADANQHTMHREIIAVERKTIEQVMNSIGHIVAVGTTSMRTLESLYFIGHQLSKHEYDTAIDHIHVDQFEPYEHHYTLAPQDAMQAILDYLDQTQQHTLHAETQIMIRPGYTFHIVNQLITNFHQPKSTLLLLVSAFVGGDWQRIYNYALSHDFRFLSYGDSSLLFHASKTHSDD